MKFQILADDAESCNLLAENLRGALKELRMDFPVEMDADPNLAASLQVQSPALAEDGKVIASGKILSQEEITALLYSLHGSEIDELRRASERRRQKAHLFKGLLLLAAVLCGVFAIVNEIRQRRIEAAAEAARPVVLKFTEPVKMLYFYRRPRPDDDVRYEVLLRRIAYEVFPEEIKRNIFSIASVDVSRPENAALIRKYDVRNTPAVILSKENSFSSLTIRDDENPQTKLIQSVLALK